MSANLLGMSPMRRLNRIRCHERTNSVVPSSVDIDSRLYRLQYYCSVLTQLDQSFPSDRLDWENSGCSSCAFNVGVERPGTADKHIEWFGLFFRVNRNHAADAQPMILPIL
eukprot:224289-Amphidinium_carterae.1